MTFRLRRLADRGFTLIELLIVILIVGVLAAIALPSFLNQTTKAHDKSAQSALIVARKNAKAIWTSADGGGYPTTLGAPNDPDRATPDRRAARRRAAVRLHRLPGAHRDRDDDQCRARERQQRLDVPGQPFGDCVLPALG